MMQPGRSYSAGSAYRYGFNGHEKADEIAGQGNHTTAEFGEYDTRLGKRWNLDPKPNPSISNYTVFVLNPIFFNDAKLDSPIIPTNTSKIDKDYKPWTSLLQRNAPGNLLKQANKRFYIQEFKDQRLSQATGVDLNLDFYKLNITKLPSGFATIGEVFSYIRIHFSEFVNGPVSRMEAYDEGERKLWESSNPSSAIIRFRGYKNGRNLDDADVLTTNYTYSNDYASWTFRPISNLNLVNPLFGGDKGHPLGGNREFGVLKSGNNYIFYIQAVDRLWSVLDEVAVGKLNDGDFFKLADKLWRQVMNNVANKINSMGGQASFDSDGVISKRISYTSDVKQSDKEQIKKAGN